MRMCITQHINDYELRADIKLVMINGALYFVGIQYTSSLLSYIEHAPRISTNRDGYCS